MTTLVRDELDNKVNSIFAGKVVRKDLVRRVKVGANVPVFVLEFLLGKYCASSDEIAIQMGLTVVNDTLAENYIRADESMKAQSKVKEKGRWTDMRFEYDEEGKGKNPFWIDKLTPTQVATFDLEEYRKLRAEFSADAFIDKVRVRLADSDYWAEVNNFGNRNVHIPNQYVRDYERLLTGGIWAQNDENIL